MHDTAPSAPPKIGQIVGILKITGGRRQETGGAIQQTKGMVGFGWFWLVFDQIDQ